jgi:hypothetical protein
MAIIDTLHYTGWPSTKVIPEKREVRVVARYITPAVYDISGKVGRLINLVIVFWLLYKYRGIWEYVGVRPSFGYVFWFLFNKIVPYLMGWILFYKYILPHLFSIKVSIIFNEKFIKLKPPWRGWKKYSRQDGFNLTVRAYTENTSTFTFSHGDGFIAFPKIYGEVKSQKLNIRLHDISQKINSWFPDEWLGSSLDAIDFEDLDRNKWPMTAKEKTLWPLTETLWFIISYLFSGTVVALLLWISLSFLNEIVGHWDFIQPPKVLQTWVGTAEYFWPSFLSVSLLFIYTIVGRGTFDLLKLLRFLHRSKRVLGCEKGWFLEKGGVFRLIIGLLNWAIAFCVSIPLIYAFAPDLLNYLLKSCSTQSNWPCLRLLLYEGKGVILGIILGGLAGFVIINVANFNKVILDFVWKLYFKNRELGIRDFLIYAYPIDPEDQLAANRFFDLTQWKKSNVQWLILACVGFLVDIVFFFYANYIDPRLGYPWWNLWRNSTWFQWAFPITGWLLVLFVFNIVIKKIGKQLGWKDHISSDITDPSEESDSSQEIANEEAENGIVKWLKGSFISLISNTITCLFFIVVPGIIVIANGIGDNAPKFQQVLFGLIGLFFLIYLGKKCALILEKKINAQLGWGNEKQKQNENRIVMEKVEVNETIQPNENLESGGYKISTLKCIGISSAAFLSVIIFYWEVIRFFWEERNLPGSLKSIFLFLNNFHTLEPIVLFRIFLPPLLFIVIATFLLTRKDWLNNYLSAEKQTKKRPQYFLFFVEFVMSAIVGVLAAGISLLVLAFGVRFFFGGAGSELYWQTYTELNNHSPFIFYIVHVFWFLFCMLYGLMVGLKKSKQKSY